MARPSTLVCLAGLIFAPLAFPASAAAAGDPLARIGNEPLGPADLDAYITGLPDHDRRLGRSQRGRAVLLEELINRRLLLRAARERGLPREEAIRRAMRRARQDVLIEALFRRVVRERVTDSRIRDYYRQRIVDSADPVLDLQQIRVGTREAARSLRARLDQGAEFEALARINAGSGPGGSDGNRGWVPLVTLAEPVRQALSDAKAGQIVGPVATDQGWLLLRVRDRHGGTAPPLAEVRTAIRRALERQAIRGLIQRLRAETEIHYPQGS